MKACKSSCVPFLLSAILLYLCLLNGVVSSQELIKSERDREALEIIIGGGGGPAPTPPCPPPPLSRLERARRVLLNFTKLINDPNGFTANWKMGIDTCNFHGIRCATFPNTNERAVAGIDLNRARIADRNCKPLSLMDSGILAKIPELTFYHVNSNNFTGTIPTEITNFKYFYELDLSNNQFLGEFPKQVLDAKQLVFLDIRFNKLRGPIPWQLFQMDLDVIFINNNFFTGYLPSNFGSTPARYLTFANNQFSGPIPKSIGNTSNTLTEVLFLGNKFEGCLPYEIGYLKKATVFDVSKNLLTGPIPHSFACLEKIQYLNLADNQFYGTVPEMVCQLPGLRNNGNFTLSNNYFTEVGPECRKLIKDKVLNVDHNCIKDLPNQRPWGQCYEFFSKVKPCPNEKYMKYVPCKGHYSPSSNLQSQRQSTNPASSSPAPVTYKSLKPHRL